LRACQASPKDLPYFGLFTPKNCECYRQAIKFFGCDPKKGQDTCEVGIYQTRLDAAHCYEFENVKPEEQWSNFPRDGTPGVKWYTIVHEDDRYNFHDIPEAQGRQAINLWNHPCLAQPWDACPDSCHGHGVCIKNCFPKETRPAWCECHKGFLDHDNCKDPDMSLCPNACSGRGKCVRGFCHCKPPWFGLDCSRSKGYPARPNHLPSRKRPVVYVYELPHSVSSPLELDDNLPDRIKIYSSYEHYLDLILKDWAIRTEDPWQANLFYIPAFTYSYSSNLGDPTPHLVHVLNYVRDNYPYYNRSNGRDHFMWFTGDKGACYAPPEVGSLIKMVHFGYHLDVKSQGEPLLHPRPMDPLNGCLHPARDIVTPPYNEVGFEDAVAIYTDIVAKKGAAPHRTNLFFFAGGVREGDHAYSGGVRQAVNKLMLHLKGLPEGKYNISDVVFIEGSTPDYRKLYNTTKFCLAPHGAGFGIRLSIAMVHGCIPVVIQDHVFQPFEDIIPYEDMSVRIAKKDIPDLIPILRSITEEEQERMRMVMAKYYRAFIWEPQHGGMAYNFTMMALYRRLNAYWGELYKHRLRSSSRRALIPQQGAVGAAAAAAGGGKQQAGGLVEGLEHAGSRMSEPGSVRRALAAGVEVLRRLAGLSGQRLGGEGAAATSSAGAAVLRGGTRHPEDDHGEGEGDGQPLGWWWQPGAGPATP